MDISMTYLNVIFCLEDVKHLCEEYFANFSNDDWKTKCAHAKKCKEEFYKRKYNIDNIIDSFIINLAEDSSDETSESETHVTLSGIGAISVFKI